MKFGKKALSLVLCLIMVFGSVAVGGDGFAEAIASIIDTLSIKAVATAGYSVGDIIEFGYYPQSLVTDETLINELQSKSTEWLSYNYYSGSGYMTKGDMVPSDYMKYTDVVVKSQKYRGVYFTKYRPQSVSDKPLASNSWQDDKGYYTFTYYWFKYAY